jgi:cobalt-zinc-cadmium efflux system membrane fusion protein
MYKVASMMAAVLLMSGCGDRGHESHAEAEHAAEESRRGPNGGRMLAHGPFAIELAIFESGVPPEYHAWPTLDGKPVPLEAVDLTVELRRLGDKVDRFAFTPHGDYLRADGIVREPHSFVVTVKAQHAGKLHEWSYDSFEGRTTIPRDIAEAAGIKTEAAGPQTLIETLSLYGRITPAASHEREVSARFPGMIRAVRKNQGDTVRAGDALAVVESNESLRTYTITAPIAGIVARRNANEGEESGERALFSIVDPSVVWAELAVFPRDRSKMRRGAAVEVRAADAEASARGKIERVDVQRAVNQTVTARATLDNSRGELLPGTFVTADVAVAQHAVALSVKASALQPFRDFTVVFEKVGDTYEVRMLELGRRHGDWVEVLGGLDAGAQYVTENSYLLKADVDKSGASHDH